MNAAEQFKINLNQNLWGAIFSFVALGMAEYYNLCTLFWLGLICSLVFTISVTCTTFAYTKKYCENKN